MKICQYNFKLDDLNISPDRVAALMGFENEPAPEPFPEMIETEIRVIPEYFDIRGGYVIHDAEIPDRSYISAGKQLFHIGRTVNKLLAGSEKMAVFVCTAGQKVSDRITELAKRGLINESYITDVIGSLVVEEAMDRIRDILKDDMAEHGLRITNRYSPGYCEWDIAEQKKLFSLLPEDFCGVKLTDTSLMIPVKSVSGFIGIGAHVKYNEYVCELCNMRHCLYRGRANKLIQ